MSCPNLRLARSGGLKARAGRLASWLVLAGLCTGLGPAHAAPPPVRGFALAPHFEGERSRASVLSMVDAVAAEGATAIQVVVQWGQADVRAQTIAPYRWGTDDAEVAAVIERAHARGLTVLLFPILRIEHTAGGEWRGALAPTSRADWWLAYGAFIAHYADLAQALGVEWLSLGSELSALEDDAAHWWALAAAVRARFRGRLTYSANWDHFAAVPFWRALDAVGINGYFPLARRGRPSPERLHHAWVGIRDALERWRRVTGLTDRPLWLTEVGYPSMEGSAARPYHHAPDGAVDLAIQAAAYEALAATWSDGSALGGVFIWAWTGPGGPEDRGYGVHGKPAQLRIRSWFAGGESSINSVD